MQLRRLVGLWGEPQGGTLDLDQPLGSVCTDSRQLAPGDLFVPLVGETFDGHGFLAQALDGGARAALVQSDRVDLIPPGLPCWTVDDTLEAYQAIACLWRQGLQAPVVAVTGSAGKTTTRELIRAVLAGLGPVMASRGNENNDVGVPLTLLKVEPQHRAVVVEMGMRGLGEIARLSRCAQPDVAVITNIGTAHIGRLGSREAIATAKCEITTALKPGGVVVIPAGDPLLEAALARVWQGRVVRVALAAADGTPPRADSQAEPTLPSADRIGHLESSGTVLQLGTARLPLPLEGDHNARNLMLALAVGEALGLDISSLGPLAVEVPGGRSRRLQLGGLQVLDETYNASPEAMLAALDLLRRQPGRHFAVLGTMLELGDRSLELHRAVGQWARELGLDGLVIVAPGPEGDALEAGAQGLGLVARVASPEAAAVPLAAWLQAGDQLLLKASRGVALERLIPLLEAQAPIR